MKEFSRFTLSFDPLSSRTLQEWRAYILDGILQGVLFLWFFSLITGINNVYETYKAEAGITPNALWLAISVMAIYLTATLLLVAITFNRKLPFRIRAGGLLLVIYIIGSVGLVFSSLSGDGRVILFAFVILSAIFFDLRYSLPAFVISFITMLAVGYLQLSGYIVVPPARQINSMDPGAWASGLAVFLSVSVAVLISISYLLRVLGVNLERAQELLKREQRLSQVLRTVTGINQLIVHEQDLHKLLNEACILLVSGRGYSFAWVGLLEPDGITLKLAAQAGDETIDPIRFNFRLDEKDDGLACAINAIQTRAFFRVDPNEADDPCRGCPRREENPHRSGVGLPLLRDGRALGVLVVDHMLPSGVFDDEEIQLLQDLANDLSYALEKITANDRLQTYARHQALLNSITQTALETLDLDAMLKKFIGGLEKMLSADGYYFALWNEEMQLPERFISSDSLHDALSSFPSVNPNEKTFSRAILDNGHVLVVEDVMSSPHINPQFAEKFLIHSALGLPLIADNHKLGALVFGFREHYSFSTDEVDLAEQAARQIALAILKAKLDSDTRAKAAELERLYAAAQDMASSLLDSPALLGKLAYHMTEALQVTSGNIMSINMIDQNMQVMGEYWSEHALPKEIHSDLGTIYPNSGFTTIMQSMLAGEVIVMHSDDENMTDVEREQFSQYGIRSMMFVPIMAHGQLFGDIELWESRHRREFTQADIRLAKAMAGHAASIIENANLVSAVRMSETRYRSLVEQAADGIFLVDPAQQLVDVNPSGCAMLGFPREEILTMHVDDFVISDGAVTLPLLIDDLLTGRSLMIERLLRRKDGTSLPVEISARMLPSGFFQGIVRDVSERKQAEKVLAEREAYFRALIENSAEGVAIIDRNGVVRYIAPSEERLTGFTQQEIQGQSAFRYVHPQDLPGLLATFTEGVATPGAVRTTEYRLQRKDGVWRYFEITGHNMSDDPHIAGVVVNYRDVTERKQAEQALQESQSRLEAIISSALNGIITMDESHKIILFNPSAERIFGYSAAEVLGQPLEILIPRRYHHSHAKHVEEYAATGETARKKGLLDSLYGIRANGEEFPMEAFISNSKVDGQRFFTVIFQDITERKRAEDALKKSERKFRALAENIPSTVYQCNNDDRYTMFYLNDSVEKLTGYPKKAFLEEGLTFFDLYHPDDLKYIPKPFEAGFVVPEKLSLHITYRIKHKSGEWRWVDEWGSGVVDDEGRVQYIEGVMVDITEWKHAEEDLRRHAMELETLAAASSALRTAQNVTDMVPILARHALRAVNGTYASIFLLDPETEEFVSRGWYSLDAEVDLTLPDESRVRHSPNEGITGRVAVNGEIYITEDIQKDPIILILDWEKERLKNVHGGISLPLRAQEKIIGIMHIWSSRPRIFNDSEIRLLTALAETTSSAIHRAILFEQTLKHANELTTAYDSTLAGWARALNCAMN